MSDIDHVEKRLLDLTASVAPRVDHRDAPLMFGRYLRYHAAPLGIFKSEHHVALCMVGAV
jgi:hypothetical protein